MRAPCFRLGFQIAVDCDPHAVRTLPGLTQVAGML